MNISLESIESRRSVRSFSGAELSVPDRKRLESAMQQAGPCPFGTAPRFRIVEPGSRDESASGRIGTYGIIRNATSFIVGAVASGPYAFADYGYALEGIALWAVGAGLGTCWLGGTFDRSGVAASMNLAPGEVVPAIMPIGEPAERRTFIDATMRVLAGSRNRKPFGELFFDGSFDAPLGETEAGPWSRVLEAVRSGPSASNKQPWRIVRTGGAETPAFHLFLNEDRSYNNAIRGIRIQELDIGIAMRHFEAAALALELPGAWHALEAPPVAYGEPLQYYSSWST